MLVNNESNPHFQLVNNYTAETKLNFLNGRATDLRILNYVHEVGSLNVPALFINGLQTVNAAPSCVKRKQF